MAEENTSPPLTIASLRAIREKKRQLIAQPLSDTLGLTHRALEDRTSIRKDREHIASPAKSTPHDHEVDSAAKQAGDESTTPYWDTNRVCETAPVMKQEDGEDNAAKDIGDIEYSTLHDTLVSGNDEPGAEEIGSILAALHRTKEPMNLSRKQSPFFHQRKRLGLILLQDVLAQRPSKQELAVTALPTADPSAERTTSAGEERDITEVATTEDLCRLSGMKSPSEHARSMLLRPHTLSMADVQALDQRIQQINKAQRNVLTVMKPRDMRQATSRSDTWIEGGVEKQRQALRDQEQQFGAWHQLGNKLSGTGSASAPRDFVLGKRSASTPLEPYDRGYTETSSPVSRPKFHNLVTENADTALLAMSQVIPDLRKAVVRDIETQIIVPTVVEYLNIVKRRKLATSATENDTGTEHLSQPSHDARVAKALPSPNAPSSSLPEFCVESFYIGIKNNAVLRGIVPSSFSIAIHGDTGDTAVHPSIRVDAYTTIFNALNATLSLDRHPGTMTDSLSQGRGSKGKWTCSYTKARNEACKWPIEGQEGQYSCQRCMRGRRTCIVAVGGIMSVAPLAPSVRQGHGPGDREYCVLPDTAANMRPQFFS